MSTVTDQIFILTHQLPCPVCRANPSSGCKDLYGYARTFHAERWEAARDAHAAGKRPEDPRPLRQTITAHYIAPPFNCEANDGSTKDQ